MAFGLAILAKLWPVVLLPVLVLRRARRAMVGTLVTLGVAGLAWVAILGPKAPFQVISFRGATGWAIESTVGNLVWTCHGRTDLSAGGRGADRRRALVGRRVALLFLLASLVLIWRRAHREDRALSGGASLAAVLALLVCSPLFSTQYVAWLTPWAALAFAEDDRDDAPHRRPRDRGGRDHRHDHASYLTRSPLTNVTEKFGLLVRNVLCSLAVGAGSSRASGRSSSSAARRRTAAAG